MHKFVKVVGFLCCLVLGLKAYAWNALGHQLVAQIAYDKLTPKARKFCKQYLITNRVSRMNPLVYASTWLDYIRIKDIHWYDPMHYTDIAFTKDNSPLPSLHTVNAVWAINQAKVVLASKKTTPAEKGLALRILIHVVGDLHQPLHSTTLISKALPQGDLGGNLFPLAENPIANQLHAYWDRGAGFLVPSSSLRESRILRIQRMAKELEKKGTCRKANALKSAQQWAAASHELAVSQAYAMEPETSPSNDYQAQAQLTVQQQLLFAGCRLAAVLNKIGSSGIPGVLRPAA